MTWRKGGGGREEGEDSFSDSPLEGCGWWVVYSVNSLVESSGIFQRKKMGGEGGGKERRGEEGRGRLCGSDNLLELRLIFSFEDGAGSVAGGRESEDKEEAWLSSVANWPTGTTRAGILLHGSRPGILHHPADTVEQSTRSRTGCPRMFIDGGNPPPPPSRLPPPSGPQIPCQY